MRVSTGSSGGGLKPNYVGLEPTQGEPLWCGSFSVPLLCRKVLLWHGIQRPPAALPRFDRGEEQRPWGDRSPDMEGIPPTSNLLLKLLHWTKLCKEGSVTLAWALQRPSLKRMFGEYSACSCNQKGAKHLYRFFPCMMSLSRVLRVDGCCTYVTTSATVHLNDFLLDLQSAMQHRELRIYNALVLGKNPEESFSLRSTDNLLTQQMLNLSCLSKEPVNLPQISAVAMLAWSLWRTFRTSPPRLLAATFANYNSYCVAGQCFILTV